MIGDAKTPEEAEREQRLRELTDDGEIISKAEYTKRSRRAFLTFGVLGVAGYAGFNRLQNQEQDEGIPKLLRAGLEWNENVWERVQRDGATARTFSIADREEIRVNGRHGIEDNDRDLIEIDDSEAATWQITLTGRNGAQLGPIPLASLKSDFEVHDMVWEHKCVEGWANIVHWTGAKFADFLAEYGPEDDDWEYMSMRTPDEDYYVGLNRYTAFHDQTLLAWAWNGQDLTPERGAPLRLVTPFKYGIKQLKRVGIIEFTNTRPTDYWYERGYDWHAGF